MRQTWRQIAVLCGCLGAAAMAVPATAAAQTGGPAVGIAVKGGLVQSDLIFSEEAAFGDFFDPARDVIAGVSVSLRPLRVWRVSPQVDVLFARKGAVDVVTGERLALDWIEVPVLAHVDVASAAGARWFAVAGAAVDVRMRARFNEIDVADQYESVATLVVAGGGASFGRWLVEGRLAWGLTNLPVAFGGSETLKERSLVVLGGFRLR